MCKPPFATGTIEGTTAFEIAAADGGPPRKARPREDYAMNATGIASSFFPPPRSNSITIPITLQALLG